MRRGLAAALASLCLAACGQDAAAPLTAVVVAWDARNDQYTLAKEPIATLSSVRNMQGASGNVQSGGTVRLFTRDVQAAGATVSQLRARSFIANPGPVAVQFNTANGLIYPEDYDALELLSFYAALENARAQFAGWGFTRLNAVPIFAHTDVRNEAGLSPLGDGELFLEPLNAFFLPVVNPQQQIPPQMNLGAIGHALGLEAWEQVVWGGSPVDPAFTVDSSDPDALTSIHVARSLRMGIADFLGALVTGDPRWFDHSLQQTAGARALDQLRCGSSAMLQALDVPDAEVPYNPYPLGTVLAYSLLETAENTDPNDLATGLFASLPGIGAAQVGNGNKLDLAAALDAIVAAAPESTQPLLCGELLDRFRALSVSAIPTCSTIGIQAPPETCE